MRRAKACLPGTCLQRHAPAAPDPFVLVCTVPAMAAARQRPRLETTAKRVAGTAPKTGARR